MDMLFLAFLPLLLFVIIEFKWGIRAGIISASVLAVLLAVYTYFKLGAVDEFLMGEVVLILALGAFSLKMKNSSFHINSLVICFFLSLILCLHCLVLRNFLDANRSLFSTALASNVDLTRLTTR